ncbi:MAG: VTT domain-containing protein [Mariniphaga sp.]|nr:VTT domain-containing protein [Mariniphaga sp.]
MEKKKVKSKVIIILITSLIAIIIVSMTVGKELYEGKSQSIFSFGLIHFSGYLFFLLMPVEMAFIYYLSYSKEAELIAVALGTAISAQIIDYLIGYSVSTKFINNIVGEKRIGRAEKYIKKYGNLTIFVFNLLPLSSPVIALVAGMLKYKFRDVLIYSICGLIIKYAVLSLLFANTSLF